MSIYHSSIEKFNGCFEKKTLIVQQFTDKICLDIFPDLLQLRRFFWIIWFVVFWRICQIYQVFGTDFIQLCLIHIHTFRYWKCEYSGRIQEKERKEKRSKKREHTVCTQTGIRCAISFNWGNKVKKNSNKVCDIEVIEHNWFCAYKKKPEEFLINF